uniref:Uncharacterized protein n=1 Tax=Anguilla anguilla TaxID=7936 RepID=A0A0E9S1P4_ANGAN
MWNVATVMRDYITILDVNYAKSHELLMGWFYFKMTD